MTKPRWSIVVVLPHPNTESILAVARHFTPRDVNLPGGHDVPEDREPIDTLKRVVFRETGLHVETFHRMTSWTGLQQQPVHAYFVTGWKGKPRSSPAGKTFWARPPQLTSVHSTFGDHNRELLEKLMRV